MQSISSTESLPISYTVYPAPSNVETAPVVIFVHGFKGFKDWGSFPLGCETIAKEGLNVVAINLSRNGVGERPMDFDRLDLFADATLSQDQNDIGSVIEAIKSGEIKAVDTALKGKIGIIGHSRGGHSVVAAAGEYEDIQTVITWAAVDNYPDRWGFSTKSDWVEKGFTDIMNGRTKQIMRLNRGVLDDAVENSDRVNALSNAAKLDIPCMFIHGTEDPAVHHDCAINLFQACPSKKKSLIIIDGAGHTFGGSHPWEKDHLPEHFAKVVSASAEFLSTHLG